MEIAFLVKTLFLRLDSLSEPAGPPTISKPEELEEGKK